MIIRDPQAVPLGCMVAQISRILEHFPVIRGYILKQQSSFRILLA